MSPMRRFLLLCATCYLALVALDIVVVRVLPQIWLKVYFYLMANKDFHSRISAYLVVRYILVAILALASITPVAYAFVATRESLKHEGPLKSLLYGAGAAGAAALASLLLVRSIGLTPLLLH